MHLFLLIGKYAVVLRVIPSIAEANIADIPQSFYEAMRY